MRAVWIAGGIVGLAVTQGCSSGALRGDDAGANLDAPVSSNDGGSPPGDAAPPTGRRSFVVTSTLMQQSTGGIGPLPIANGHRFTMIVDWDGRLVILGADGSGRTLPFQSAASGGSISESISFSLGDAAGVSYQRFDFTVSAADTLSGAAQGQAVYTPPGTDVSRATAVTASLMGVPDTERPTLTATVNGAQIDPPSAVAVTASEPLPPDTRISFVDLQGNRTDLFAIDGSGASASLFAPTPFKMWRYNDRYSLLIDGVVDFAGNGARAGSAIAFTTGGPPPLAAADGFESVTGTTFASAQVLSGSGAPTISGARSLYIPAVPSAIPPGTGDVTQLALRIALDATDTVVRFSYRSVNPTSPGIGANPAFVFGAPGSEVKAVTLGPDSGPPVSAALGQETVMLGPVMTAELVLPPGTAAAGEVTIMRKLAGCCYGLPSPPVGGLILDDLRAE